MAPPRKSVSRGTGELENDPERENRTQARAPNPVADDPERANKTQARVQNPVADDEAADVLTHGDDLARALAPEDERSGDGIDALALIGVDEVHAGRGHSHEHLLAAGHGQGLVTDLEDVASAIAGNDESGGGLGQR